jgi:hypothetical protein
MKLPPIPTRIKTLKWDQRGYPIPWFVHTDENGVADFRVIGEGKLERAMREERCWVCGEKRGKFQAFLIGPMCAINRTISEPPSHRDCAVFSAKACPFMNNPDAPRRETNIPDHAEPPAGDHIKRNPGVSLVWVTLSSMAFRPPGGGVLFRLGPPEECLWFARGRTATREEILHSIDTGLPLLRNVAEQEGPEAVAALDQMHAEALKLVPAA